MSAGAVTIVLADDHAVVRAGLRLLLDGEPDMTVVGEAADANAAEQLLKRHKPRILVLDIKLRGESGVSALPRLVAGAPGTDVVVLTMQDDPEYARAALAGGARGYVVKEAAEYELVQAIRDVAAGGTYVNPALGARLASTPPRPDNLTERELEILRLIALGHTNAEIAAQLYLSVRTIESHRAHIQQKTRRTTRAELVRYALELGLLGEASGSGPS